jgi:hypothetical protein
MSLEEIKHNSRHSGECKRIKLMITMLSDAYIQQLSIVSQDESGQYVNITNNILDMSDIDRGSRRVQKNGPLCTPQMMHPQLAHNDLYWADSYELDFPAFDMRTVKSNDKMNLKLLHRGFKGKSQTIR